MLRSSKKKVWIRATKFHIHKCLVTDIQGKLLQTTRVKSPLAEDPNLSQIQTQTKMVEALREDDEDADSLNYAVEESDLHSPVEETLDLTIMDEFTEECKRW